MLTLICALGIVLCLVAAGVCAVRVAINLGQASGEAEAAHLDRLAAIRNARTAEELAAL